MNKEELIKELLVKVSDGEITREELVNKLNLVDSVTSKDKAEKESSRFSVTKAFYIIGAAVVAIGVIIFTYQIWNDIGSFLRVLITLGLGIVFTLVGSILLKQKPDDNIGPVFHFIGGLLVPGGAMVTLSELSLDTGDWTVAITFGVISAFYLLLNYVHKNVVLTFFTIANATITTYLVLNAVVGGPFEGWFGIKDIYQYMTMVIGISYLLLAYSFRDGWNKKLAEVLCFFGTTAFLSATFLQVFDSAPWRILYFLIVIGGFALSVFMKSRSILIMSALFLITHVSYITGKYFADSVGWPISLVILGFVFIGLGYVSININRNYIVK